MHTGSIVDFYDDPQGTVLKEKVAFADIPEYIRECEFLSTEKRASLPDEAYAVVMVDQGGPIRKYACVDKGNTALSVLYFMENHERLPEEAIKVAAANLAEACDAFELQTPWQLNKLSGKKKVGDVVGTEIMPTQPDKKGGDEESIKTAEALYVDVTGHQPMQKLAARQYEHYCLVKEGQSRFPIDSYGQVLEANQWFDENSYTLHPSDRRDYCVKLASRADDLGIMVTDKIRKYAGQGFAPDGEIRIAVAGRMQHWADDAPERNMLTGLMDKYASVTPDVFCSALRQFDEATGLNHLWDDEVYDPWYSTYGFEKKAEWVWEQGNDRVTEEQLAKGCKENIQAVRERFGEDLANEMCVKPTQVFDSLPLDAKRIISRLVTDPQ